ncbi:hypothetical protein RHGRI_025041 [Rhododendron griersonianum]|uniref:Uncharacterized protein n=1 Tax=Rhododendron griersonianum TaxID=479676 RepID=A0AAV6JD77_9ERIC|nr:hypothetical protein RHGRI_025041 [Rhododendron griersonianum]
MSSDKSHKGPVLEVEFDEHEVDDEVASSSSSPILSDVDNGDPFENLESSSSSIVMPSPPIYVIKETRIKEMELK